MKLNFGLIGKGYISKYHINAIENLNHNLVSIYDPFLSNLQKVEDLFKYNLDYVVICSPTNFHYEHVKLALKNNVKIICEKPLFPPWIPLFDNNDINIVLQYEYCNLPDTANLLEVTMVRDEEYFKTWKGNSFYTGGIFYNLFIHYFMISIKTGARFVGKILHEGTQVRKLDNIDLTKIDTIELYTKMYNEIISGNGRKPKDIFYLMWVLNHCNLSFGMGKELIGKTIHFDPKNITFMLE